MNNFVCLSVSSIKSYLTDLIDVLYNLRLKVNCFTMIKSTSNKTVQGRDVIVSSASLRTNSLFSTGMKTSMPKMNYNMAGVSRNTAQHALPATVGSAGSANARF